MASIKVLCVGGTGESYAGDERREVTGALSAFTKVLDPAQFIPEWVGYPASYGSTHSYEESVSAGSFNLYQRCLEGLGETHYANLIVGYSQGAVIVQKMVEAARLSQIPEAAIAGGLTIGNPRRNGLNDFPGLKLKPGTYGIAGKGMSLPMVDGPFLLDMVVPGDPIAEMTKGALLRDVADFTGFMSLSTLKQWGEETRRLIKTQGFQNAGRKGVTLMQAINLLGEAGADLRRYLPYDRFLNPTGGRHTAYASELAVLHGVKQKHTWCEALGHGINRLVNGEPI